ncbi:MAG: DNA cytosine methyltransferase [Parvibaculum sp.]|nr:DNA cytosine methyltransferase [Parvibaculum sp.]
MRPIGIDLFSGAGGLSLGFEQAGFDVVAAVEIDPVHAAIHKFNFPKCAVLARSVADLSAEDIRKHAQIGNRPVDVVFGGAPCQGFSLIGHRALDDPRNSLVREFVRIVAELDASYFVFENVKGLTVGRHRKFLDELIGEFSDRGYDIHVPWQVLNAAHYGVPQSRERLILLGAKRGLPLPHYPERTTRKAGTRDDSFLPAGPSCYDALGDLPDAESFPDLWETDAVETNGWGTPSDYARKMRCLDNDAWYFGHPRKWTPQMLTSSMRTKHSSISRRRFAETAKGEVEPISRFFKLPANGVSNTLRAGTDAARGAFTSPRPIHYEFARCITVREMARLHGFPDWFRFHETKWHGARQIGNAVPPPLARAVAQQIVRALGVYPTRPDEEIPLGDPDLLRLGMAEAAKFFGIDSPIGRRDRKSGAKKRKQEEVEQELEFRRAANG